MSMRRRNQTGQVAGGILAAIVGAAVIVGLAIGGWQLGWWVKGQTVNRNAKINRQSYEVQQTYREKVLDDISLVGQIDREIADPSSTSVLPQLRAQRIADVRVSCDHISRLKTSGAGDDPDIDAFHDKECSV